jgi:hypothetical protein
VREFGAGLSVFFVCHHVQQLGYTKAALQPLALLARSVAHPSMQSLLGARMHGAFLSRLQALGQP